MDAGGKVVGPAVGEQASQALLNLATILESEEASLANIVHWSIAVVDGHALDEGVAVFPALPVLVIFDASMTRCGWLTPGGPWSASRSGPDHQLLDHGWPHPHAGADHRGIWFAVGMRGHRVQRHGRKRRADTAAQSYTEHVPLRQME